VRSFRKDDFGSGKDGLAETPSLIDVKVMLSASNPTHIVGHIKFKGSGLDAILDHPLFVHLENEGGSPLRHLKVVSVSLPVFRKSAVVRPCNEAAVCHSVSPSPAAYLERAQTIAVISDSVRLEVRLDDPDPVNKVFSDDRLGLTGRKCQQE
jgi:hypothetical protein